MLLGDSPPKPRVMAFSCVGPLFTVATTVAASCSKARTRVALAHEPPPLSKRLWSNCTFASREHGFDQVLAVHHARHNNTGNVQDDQHDGRIRQDFVHLLHDLGAPERGG